MIGTNEKTEFILKTMFHELQVFFTKMQSARGLSLLYLTDTNYFLKELHVCLGEE